MHQSGKILRYTIGLRRKGSEHRVLPATISEKKKQYLYTFFCLDINSLKGYTGNYY